MALSSGFLEFIIKEYMVIINRMIKKLMERNSIFKIALENDIILLPVVGFSCKIFVMAPSFYQDFRQKAH